MGGWRGSRRWWSSQLRLFGRHLDTDGPLAQFKSQKIFGYIEDIPAVARPARAVATKRVKNCMVVDVGGGGLKLNDCLNVFED